MYIYHTWSSSQLIYYLSYRATGGRGIIFAYFPWYRTHMTFRAWFGNWYTILLLHVRLKCIFCFSLRDIAIGLIKMFGFEVWIMLDLKLFWGVLLAWPLYICVIVLNIQYYNHRQKNCNNFNQTCLPII